MALVRARVQVLSESLPGGIVKPVVRETTPLVQALTLTPLVRKLVQALTLWPVHVAAFVP